MMRARQIFAIAAVATLVGVAATEAGATGTTSSRDAGPAPASYVRVASLFGESDEEKAARLQHEADQDAQIKALSDRIHDLEETVRNLTGQNEELSHRVSELNAKTDRQQKDFESRLCAMAAQLVGASTGQDDPNAVPCPGSAGQGASYTPPPSAPARNAAPSGQAMAPPPGVLGTLPASQTGGAPAAADSSRPEYDAAMALLSKGRYDDARSAFRAFADAHPDSALAPQALYWIGNIAYAQKDYDSATHQFAEVLKKYPTWTRAPDTMLKLGQTLVASGDKKGGCTFLAALPSKYPKADKAVLAQGAEVRRAACRGDS